MSKRLPSGLTDQQERFCLEYLKDLNGTKAAERAGYSTKSAQEQASRLLSNDMVSARCNELMHERSSRLKIDADYVLSTIQETIERCKQAVEVMEYSPELKEMVHTGTWKFEHSGVLKGCELLGKHLKLFTEKVEHSGKVTLDQLVVGSMDDDKE